MLASVNTITTKIKKGTTPTLELLLKKDGSVFDLTNCTAVFKWRLKSSSANQPNITAIINDDPTTGIIYIRMAASDTNVTAGTYFYEVFVTNGSTGIIDAFPINSKDTNKNDFGELVVVDSL